MMLITENTVIWRDEVLYIKVPEGKVTALGMVFDYYSNIPDNLVKSVKKIEGGV